MQKENQRSRQNVFITFLDLLGVKHTTNFSNKYYNEHPHKYNLFGLSKMLTEFNIENAAFKIKNKKESLSVLEIPFIAHTGTDFVVVKEKSSQKISYIWNGKNIDISFDEYCKLWTGVVLLAEPNANSIEPEFKEHIRAERIHTLKKIILSVFLILLLAYFRLSIHSFFKFNLLLVINTIGIYISYLLVQKQMKVQSDYVDKICSLFKQGDCNNVLESDVARLWNILSWSEIGLGYFISNICALLFFPQLISYILLINICTLPYTVWSIWYQGFKVNQWCPLCLIVQGLLWSIFLTNFFSGNILLPTFHYMDILIISCLYVIPVLIINLIISGLSKSENVEQIKQEINSIKTTDEVFVALLKKQPYYEVTRNTSQIILGDASANILVTILTNPHCNPCAKMHKRVEKLLEENIGKLCVQYIFSSFNESLNSSSQFLISIYMNEPNKRKEIMNSWFEDGKNDRYNFFRLYNWDSTENVLSEFEKHENWIKKTGLSSTPTILVNGYKMPDNYMIEDLRYFMNLVLDTR